MFKVNEFAKTKQIIENHLRVKSLYSLRTVILILKKKIHTLLVSTVFVAYSE